jgi:chaperonin GroES
MTSRSSGRELGVKMNVRPLFDRILVKRNEEPTKTKSGLFLPETTKEKPSEGTVLAVGNGRIADDGKVTALTVKVGDQVIFGKYSGTEIKVDGDDRLILREDDVLGIVE